MREPRRAWWAALTPLGWVLLVFVLLGLGFACALWWNPAPPETGQRPTPRYRPVRGLEVERLDVPRGTDAVRHG